MKLTYEERFLVVEWKKTVAVSEDYDTAEHVRDGNNENKKK